MLSSGLKCGKRGVHSSVGLDLDEGMGLKGSKPLFTAASGCGDEVGLSCRRSVSMSWRRGKTISWIKVCGTALLMCCEIAYFKT